MDAAAAAVRAPKVPASPPPPTNKERPRERRSERLASSTRSRGEDGLRGRGGMHGVRGALCETSGPGDLAFPQFLLEKARPYEGPAPVQLCGTRFYHGFASNELRGANAPGWGTLPRGGGRGPRFAGVAATAAVVAAVPALAARSEQFLARLRRRV